MKGFFELSVVQNDAPDSLIPKCGSCGLYKDCNSPRMEPFGKGKRKVLVVGEAPGQNEDDEGRPFIGKAGEYLRDVLDELGVDLDKDCLTTNALICRPPKNRTPDAKEIGYCRPNLIKTIEGFQPSVVITLGRAALHSVITPYWKQATKEISRWVGWKIPIAQHWICPTYHPSFLLRSNDVVLDRLFRNHLEAAFNIDEEPPKAVDYTTQVERLFDEKDIWDALKDMDRQGGLVAFDYETNCLKPEYPKARIVCASFSNGKRTIAFPWVGKAIEATSKFLSSDRTGKLAANLRMEERWTRKFLGHGVNKWVWDPILAAHCLDNRTGITSLKFQAFVILGVNTYNRNIEPYLESFNGHYNRIEEVEIGTLLTYNGIDSILTKKLAKIQMEEMGL